MLEPDDHNPIFKIASEFVNDTDRSIFLTGKAGSGKTTFLRHIVSTTHKNCVVVAPTGVAAINAGGVTMHSFFQLPFGPFLPDTQRKFNGVEASDKYRLFKNIRFGEDKRKLINELELLIIDEVSMVRCDMLDAMDAILRHFRRKPHLAFGGVQVLFIGDLFQLPPVAKNEEWEILRDFYESPFFFHSQVVQAAPPLYIELKKIYRQSDEDFIELLNRVRNNRVIPQDLKLLNSKFNMGISPPAEENYITLCTHNYKADAVNASELAKLKTPVHRFRGTITGDFSEKALPTEMELQLKEGAQVIFIKNDSDVERRYYNGKIAVIESIEGEQIKVRFPEGNELKLDRETWHHIKYAYNRETESIDEEDTGSYKQFPVRLAWAITIHKSQGLTFQKAIIDAGSSFAAGQVYVALSRCTSLDGLLLHSEIREESISTDERVVAFAKREHEAHVLEQLLSSERQRYLGEQLILVFDFGESVAALEHYLEEIPGRKIPDPEGTILLTKRLLTKANEILEVGRKFQVELGKLLNPESDQKLLEDRVRKAIDYFYKFYKEELVTPLAEHETAVKKAPKIKSYLKLLRMVKLELVQQMQELRDARYGEMKFNPLNEEEKVEIASIKKSAAPKKRGEKGSSLKETLALFKSGKSIEEIAKLRDLAASTIESHLADLVKTSELDIHDLIPETKLKAILEALDDPKNSSVTLAKISLGEGYSYGEIRAVANSRELRSKE